MLSTDIVQYPSWQAHLPHLSPHMPHPLKGGAIPIKKQLRDASHT